jgi:hypothetical protein
MKFQIKRTITAVVGVIVGMLIVLGANVPAQAAPGAPIGNVNDAAVSPSISPAAERIRYVADPYNYSCASGRACFAVWDPNRSRYKVFDLYYCNTYNLSYWHDWGTFRNSQTGGATVILYGQSGPLPGSYPPFSGYYEGNWDPVWRIKPC